jgi:hypothetical protein
MLKFVHFSGGLLRVGIFVAGAIILVIGLLIVLTISPRADMMVIMMGGYGGLAPMMPEYQALQGIINTGLVLIVIGIIIMIPGIILKKKAEELDEEDD